MTDTYDGGAGTDTLVHDRNWVLDGDVSTCWAATPS